MKLPYLLRDRCGSCALTFVGASLLVASILGGDVKNERKKEREGSQATKRRMEEATKMVDAIANITSA